MDFNLSPSYRQDLEKYRDFAENKIKPCFGKMEKENAVPLELIKKMGDAGFMGIPMPKQYGGLGKDFVSAALCMEELSKVSPAAAGIINVNTELVANCILCFGTEAQKQKYLPDLCSGKTAAAFAITEPGAGSDAGALRTSAENKGGVWELNGTKCFITNAGIASIFLIAAMTKVEGKRKISLFIVEKNYPGFTVGKHEDKMGIRASSTCELILEDCLVPESNLLGRPGKGLNICLNALDGGRVMIAAQSLGLAQGCWDEAVSCLKSGFEESGGAINSQRVQFALAELQTKIEAARLLVYRAAALWSAGESYSKEAAMAKYYASTVANDAARICVQLTGWKGCTYGGRLEQFFRDAKITEIYEGTNEIQLMVIAGQLELKM